MKEVVSVSLGSSKRDFERELRLGEHVVRLRRVGSDGSLTKAKELIAEVDGKVDAIGLGGADLHFYIEDKCYTMADIARLAKAAKVSPVVCGAGLKRSLEKRVVEELEEHIDWQQHRVLMMSIADRFGMAQSLAERCKSIVFGDLMFALGIPLPIQSIEQGKRLTQLLLPVICRLPFTWLYPTGEKQEINTPRFRKAFEEASVIAGDWHFIRRFAPHNLRGKIVLTNTTTTEDVAWLQARAVSHIYTTTPRLNGRSIATNVLEAALIACAGRFPLSQADYQALIAEYGLGLELP